MLAAHLRFATSRCALHRSRGVKVAQRTFNPFSVGANPADSTTTFRTTRKPVNPAACKAVSCPGRHRGRSPFFEYVGDLAHSAERLFCTQQAAGAEPAVSTTFPNGGMRGLGRGCRIPPLEVRFPACSSTAEHPVDNRATTEHHRASRPRYGPFSCIYPAMFQAATETPNLSVVGASPTPDASFFDSNVW